MSDETTGVSPLKPVRNRMRSNSISSKGRSSRDVPDTFSHAGASRLCGIIKAYWLKRGYAVTPTVVLLSGRDVPDEGGVVNFAVRLADFVNGMPPAACKIVRKSARVARAAA